MDSNKARNKKSNEGQYTSKETFSSRPTHADNLEAAKRGTGAVVPCGRVLQLTRELLHGSGPDSRGVARKARGGMGIARRSGRGTISTALRGPTPDHRRTAHPPSSGERIHEQARGKGKRDGTPRRVGRDGFSPEERIVD